MAAEPKTMEEISKEGEIEYEKGYGSGPFGTREIVLFKGFSFNPVVTIAAAIVLWAFVIYVSVDDKGALEDFQMGQSWVTTNFTWLYIASQQYWVAFVFPLCYYYGHVKLGQDDDTPEYSDGSYFAMVFCAGVAIGLVFYGASEPLWHMLSSGGANRYNNNKYQTENQAAQDAMNVTIFHWGFQAWIVYALTAVTMGFLSYRKGLPLCFRTVLAPLFGKATWGWFGDFIDVVTIVTIVAGLCTSLGMGAKQICGGLSRLDVIDCVMTEDEVETCQWVIILIITQCATLSVVTGLDWGIKFVSLTAFVLGNVIMISVFFLDDRWYIMNLGIQTLGYHLQHFIEIGFMTDAFAQLRPGLGMPLDGKGAAAAWMDWWTIFYWGWWIAWAPFVGTFLARISKGRTILNVIVYSLTVPFVYSLCWFCTFGGAAIKMHRRAEYFAKKGLELHTNADYWLHGNNRGAGQCRPSSAGKCYDVPQWVVGDATYQQDKGLSPVCAFKGGNADGYWFDLMNQYHEQGFILGILSIILIVLYFVTSSDSGSLVVDLIAANGKEAHVIQRVFWAQTEGAVAIALLIAGGQKSMKALQALSIIAGLPFTVILMFMCSALWRALKIDAGHMPARGDRTDWSMPLYAGIFDLLEKVLTLGRSDMPETTAIVNFFLGFFCPPLLLFKSLRGLSEKQKALGGKEAEQATTPVSDALSAVFCAITYYMFWIFHFVTLALGQGLDGGGWNGYGWTAGVGFAVLVTVGRHNIRRFYGITGSGIEDFTISLFAWPQTLAQMAKQVTEERKAPKLKEEPVKLEMAAVQIDL